MINAILLHNRFDLLILLSFSRGQKNSFIFYDFSLDGSVLFLLPISFFHVIFGKGAPSARQGNSTFCPSVTSRFEGFSSQDGGTETHWLPSSWDIKNLVHLININIRMHFISHWVEQNQLWSCLPKMLHWSYYGK